MVKRKYKIKKIPKECLEGKEFSAEYQWDLFCLWTGPDGVVYGIFEMVEEV